MEYKKVVLRNVIDIVCLYDCLLILFMTPLNVLGSFPYAYSNSEQVLFSKAFSSYLHRCLYLDLREYFFLVFMIFLGIHLLFFFLVFNWFPKIFTWFCYVHCVHSCEVDIPIIECGIDATAFNPDRKWRRKSHHKSNRHSFSTCKKDRCVQNIWETKCQITWKINLA